MNDDNEASVRRVYREFLVDKSHWNWLQVRHSKFQIMIETRFYQGKHISYGWPIVLAKNYEKPVVKKRAQDVLGSLYTKVKQQLALYWHNQ